MFLRKFTTSSTRQAIIYSKEVHQALQSHSPVVALESTIISHGMPYPQNLETALQVEDDVRANGAVPATIALMDGDLCIGLEQIQLERLARDGLSATKCSRRDLARVLSQKDLGATTVSGTMIASKLAGIDVFVTGGIGGVHRGVEDTMDVSADLTELARTPVVVVCAGVKSILDIPRTLEYLETQGVAVMCWQTDRFPAFFTVDSGEKAFVHDSITVYRIVNREIENTCINYRKQLHFDYLYRNQASFLQLVINYRKQLHFDSVY